MGLFFTVFQGPRGLCSRSLTNAFPLVFCCHLIRQKAALLKSSVPSVVSAQRKANNDWLISCFCSCFVPSWKQINSAATLASVPFSIWSHWSEKKRDCKCKDAKWGQEKGMKEKRHKRRTCNNRQGNHSFCWNPLWNGSSLSFGQNDFSNYKIHLKICLSQ